MTATLAVLAGVAAPLGAQPQQPLPPRLGEYGDPRHEESLFYRDARYQAYLRGSQGAPWRGAVIRLGADVFRLTNGDAVRASQAMEAADVTFRQIAEKDRKGELVDPAKSFAENVIRIGGPALVSKLQGVPHPLVSVPAHIAGVGIDLGTGHAGQDFFTSAPGFANLMLVNPLLADGQAMLHDERVRAQAFQGQVLWQPPLSQDEFEAMIRPSKPNVPDTADQFNRVSAFEGSVLSYALKDSPWVEPRGTDVPGLMEANGWYANDVRTKQLLGLAQSLKNDTAAILAGQGQLLRNQDKILGVSRDIQRQVEAHRRETREAFQAVYDRVGLMHSDLTLQNAMIGAGIEGVKERLQQVDVKVTDIQRWVEEQRELAKAQAALAEKLGAFDSTVGFLRRLGQVSGDPKVARFLDRWTGGVQIAKEVEVIRGRVQNAAMLSGLGKAALTMDAASVSLQVIGFLAGGGGPADLDAVILEELRKLSRDMHDRFDRVDASLNVLHAKLGKLADAIDLLRSDVRQARLALEELQTDLTRLARDADVRLDELRHLLSEDALEKIGEAEAVYVRGPRGNRVGLTREKVGEALSRFEFYATAHSRRDIYRQNAFPIREARTAQELLGFVPQLGRDPYAVVESTFLIGERLLGVPRPKGVPADLPHARVWARAADDFLAVLWANWRTYGHAGVDPVPQLDDIIRTGARLRYARLGGRDEARWTALLEQQEKATIDTLKVVGAAYKRYYKDRLCALPEVRDRLQERFYPADLDDRRQTLALLEKEFPPELLAEADRPLAALVPPELRAWLKLRQVNGLPPIPLKFEATLYDAGIHHLMHTPRLRFTPPGGPEREVRLVADWSERFGKALPRRANVAEPDTIPGFGTESVIRPTGAVTERISKAAKEKGLAYDRPALLQGLAADLAALRVAFAKEVAWAATGGDKVRAEDFKALTGEEGLAVRRAVEPVTAYQRLLQWHLELFAPDLLPTLGPSDSRQALFVPGAYLAEPVVSGTVLALQGATGAPDQLPLYHPAVKEYRAYRNAVLDALNWPAAPPPPDTIVDATLANLLLAREAAGRLQTVAREQQRLNDLLDAAARRPDGEHSPTPAEGSQPPTVAAEGLAAGWVVWPLAILGGLAVAAGWWWRRRGPAPSGA